MVPSVTSESIGQRALRELVYEGEAVPWLLRGRVLVGLAVLMFLIMGVYLVLLEIFGFPTSLDAEPLQDWVDERGALGPVAFIAAMALSVLFAPVPNIPIFAAAGLIWGPVLGTVYSMVGMMIGSVLAFYTARIAGRKHIHKFIGRRAAVRIDGLVDSFGGRVVFWARMLPIVNFDWISFLAGVTSIRVAPFLLWSFVGMLLPTSVGVVAGDALGRDVRVTLVIGAVWVGSIILTGGYMLWRSRRSRDAPTATDP